MRNTARFDWYRPRRFILLVNEPRVQALARMKQAAERFVDVTHIRHLLVVVATESDSCRVARRM